ncbi:hypothetical protein F5141DRAFT_1066836 [Pisolithus sp. B1]|nr:hypothetical protein F5141DRAFT_1066836 [Pisolithus sp. B1]
MTDPPLIDASGQANQPFASSSTCGHGHGCRSTGATHAEKIPKIQWDDKDLNVHAHTAWLISWLCKKYNEANKTLGAMGAGLTSAKLEEHLDMKLLDKIIANFPWWEELHSFWRTNPSYNMVFSTSDPGQDFTWVMVGSPVSHPLRLKMMVLRGRRERTSRGFTEMIH